MGPRTSRRVQRETFTTLLGASCFIAWMVLAPPGMYVYQRLKIVLLEGI